MFVSTTPHQILFGGLPIDCTVKDFAGSAVCTLLKDSPDLEADGENRYKFSLFGHVITFFYLTLSYLWFFLTIYRLLVLFVEKRNGE